MDEAHKAQMILHWVKYDFEKRRQYCYELIKYIDFDRLSSSNIRQLLDEVISLGYI